MRMSDWSSDVCSSDLAGIDPDMELDEILGAAPAGTKIVNPLEFRLARRDLDEAAALILRPFLVHQLVDRMARRPERAPGQPQGDGDAEDGIGGGAAELLI